MDIVVKQKKDIAVEHCEIKIVNKKQKDKKTIKTVFTMANSKLDRLDKQILKMIAEDARVAFLEVARVCEVSGAAIHQRIQKLTSMGILKGSQ